MTPSLEWDAKDDSEGDDRLRLRAMVMIDAAREHRLVSVGWEGEKRGGIPVFEMTGGWMEPMGRRDGSAPLRELNAMMAGLGRTKCFYEPCWKMQAAIPLPIV